MMTLPAPKTVSAYTMRVPDDFLKLTNDKLKLARFPEEYENVDEQDWSECAKVSEVKRLTEYWRDRYDWRAQEDKINSRFNQFVATVDTGPRYGEQTIHFAHHRSPQADAVPLLFVAGWPGSFLEAGKLIEPLTNPPTGTCAFHLVVASIPGFGPGEAPKRKGFGPVTTANAFKEVMVGVLGYEKFVTQGGDVGASITRLMALQFPQHVKAYHLNVVPVRPPSWKTNPLVLSRFLFRSRLYSEKELSNVHNMIKWQNEEAAYSKVHQTKPQSLGFGTTDSPIGLLAWFLEKFHSWMDTENYKMSDDKVITFVMMHWLHGGTPGFRFYKSRFQEAPVSGPNGEQWTREDAWQTYLLTPLGYSSFPKEIALPPLDWIRAVANLSFHREHDKGGHFAAVEQPELLVGDLREWFGGEVVQKALKT